MMVGFLIILKDEEHLPTVTKSVYMFQCSILEITLPFLGALYWKESGLKKNRDTRRGKMKVDERLILKSNNL